MKRKANAPLDSQSVLVQRLMALQQQIRHARTLEEQRILRGMMFDILHRLGRAK